MQINKERGNYRKIEISDILPSELKIRIVEGILLPEEYLGILERALELEAQYIQLSPTEISITGLDLKDVIKLKKDLSFMSFPQRKIGGLIGLEFQEVIQKDDGLDICLNSIDNENILKIFYLALEYGCKDIRYQVSNEKNIMSLKLSNEQSRKFLKILENKKKEITSVQGNSNIYLTYQNNSIFVVSKDMQMSEEILQGALQVLFAEGAEDITFTNNKDSSILSARFNNSNAVMAFNILATNFSTKEKIEIQIGNFRNTSVRIKDKELQIINIDINIDFLYKIFSLIVSEKIKLIYNKSKNMVTIISEDNLLLEGIKNHIL